HRHRRRPDLQPGADALHHARGLPRLRPHGAAPRPPAGAAPGGAGRGAGARGGRRLSLSTPFIERPIATTLLTVAVALAGGIPYQFLPVSPLPQVDFPTINVSSNLPGASP